MKCPLFRIHLQRFSVWLSLWIAMFAGASAPSFGGIVEPSGEFDHLATGFPLEGRHQLLSCETCHRDGEFKGLPKLCAGCHDGKTARGKHINHIPTVGQCNVCHVPQGFNIGAVMDHSTTTMPCAACHNNLLASGQSTSHLKTSNNCAGCHTTSGWVPVTRFDHTETNQPCFTCHNGRLATGKSIRHVDTSDVCAACHRTVSFSPAYKVDHKEMPPSARCAVSGCHDGISRQGKSPNHARTSTECGACHSVTAATWKGVFRVQHKQVQSGACTDCHDFNKTSISRGLVATPQPVDHVPTTASCDLCHDVTVWIPARRVHSVLTLIDRCVSCHVDGIRGGFNLKQFPTHIPSTSVCEICHTGTGRSSLADWKKPNIATDLSAFHTQTLGTCASCHDGVKAKGKNLGHVVTSADCSVCHKSTTTFLGAAVDHTGFVKNCTNCHGVTASGKSGKHSKGLNTTNNCDSCHNIFPASWKPAFTFDHAQIQPATACAACHGTALAKTGKPTNHIPTTAACDTCHSGVTNWTTVDTNHSSFINLCVTCHTGTFLGAKGKIGKHLIGLQTSDICEACHDKKPRAWTPLITFNHNQATNPTACSTCHNGTLAQGMSPGHPRTSLNCGNCHTNSSSWKRPLSVQMKHTETGSAACGDSGCHATTRSASHILIRLPPVCDACHTSTTTWATSLVDHNQVSGSCANCHNGTTATGKGGLHSAPFSVTTSNLCDACHFIPPQRFNSHKTPFPHGETTAPCVSCHNATFAAFRYKTSGHMATSDTCVACHTTGGWTPATTNHAEVFLPTATCVSCHNGTTRGRTTYAGHCSIVGFDCDDCHSASNFSTWVSVVANLCGTTPPGGTTPTPTPVPTATVTLSASPTSVTPGSSSTLTWSSTGATTCNASGAWLGTKALTGTEVRTNLTATSTFTLTCGVASRSVSVAVTAAGGGPSFTLSASALNVAVGGSSTLTWSSASATACTASGAWSGTKALTGSETRGNLTSTSTFTLSCTGPGGSANRSVTVNVAAPTPTSRPTPTPSPIPTPRPTSTPPPSGGGGGGGGGMPGSGGMGGGM